MVLVAAAVADNSVTDAKIAAHTTTKITTPFSLTTGVAQAGAAITEAAEAASTPVADTQDTATLINLRLYTVTAFTLPTTSKWYVITGIEWKNGATVAGQVICGVDVDITTGDQTVTVAFGQEIAQAGINAVQRQSNIGSKALRGGRRLTPWISLSDTTATVRTTAANTYRKSITYTSNTPTTNSTSTAQGAANPYIKIYYIGIG